MKVGHGFSNLAQSTDCTKAAYMGAKPINIHVHGQNAGNKCLCSLFPSCFEEESGYKCVCFKFVIVCCSNQPCYTKFPRVSRPLQGPKFPRNLNFQASSFQRSKFPKVQISKPSLDFQRPKSIGTTFSKSFQLNFHKSKLL